ncbi:hypothetical protein [Peribacillus frigoritolerans]|uniref:hypothetical protein n=1 Tax=Peribacillus frigoritolerans TaxID=450367 RepID=UPI0023D98197|nr:hypothetical protein [Peribacillus frigoritolerans]MDF1997603.1 hypothetical protein [Peribacillus frigoritolerans]
MNWIIQNMDWLFGGIGAMALASICGLIVKKKRENENSNQSIQSIQSGDDSSNIQGRDNITVNIGEKHEK